jgi:hypothetical protein
VIEAAGTTGAVVTALAAARRGGSLALDALRGASSPHGNVMLTIVP